MNLCRTCMYALYDGMCLAHGKFTLLDAPACDDYKMRVNVEVSKLKAENAKLREACAELLKMAERHDPEWIHWPEMHDELRKLRVEVDG